MSSVACKEVLGYIKKKFTIIKTLKKNTYIITKFLFKEIQLFFKTKC